MQAASIVDHVMPHKQDKTLFWDSTNWQSLCKDCHGLKGMRENRMMDCLCAQVISIKTRKLVVCVDCGRDQLRGAA